MEVFFAKVSSLNSKVALCSCVSIAAMSFTSLGGFGRAGTPSFACNSPAGRSARESSRSINAPAALRHNLANELFAKRNIIGLLIYIITGVGEVAL